RSCCRASSAATSSPSWKSKSKPGTRSAAARISGLIRFSQVTLARGAKILIEGADLTLHQGERIGLIGANGSGKTSLFSLLRGELHADKGDVELPAHWRIAHVAQETPALDRPATEYAIDGDEELRELEAKLAAAEAAGDGTLM